MWWCAKKTRGSLNPESIDNSVQLHWDDGDWIICKTWCTKKEKQSLHHAGLYPWSLTEWWLITLLPFHMCRVPPTLIFKFYHQIIIQAAWGLAHAGSSELPINFSHKAGSHASVLPGVHSDSLTTGYIRCTVTHERRGKAGFTRVSETRLASLILSAPSRIMQERRDSEGKRASARVEIRKCWIRHGCYSDDKVQKFGNELHHQVMISAK